MPSKQVSDRQKIANALGAALTTHATQAASGIKDLLSPHLHAGETVPDIALLLTLVQRALTSSTGSLVAADQAHIAELADDDPARAARDHAASTLRSECIDLREILTGLYGAAFANQMLAEAVPRDPVMLLQYAKTLEENLQRATLPTARVVGATIDKSAVITRIGSLRQSLELTIGAVAREVREAQATQTAKDKALDAFDDVFSKGADVSSSLLRLAGMPEHAAKVRASAKRSAHGGDDESPPEAAPAAPANT